VLRKRAEGGPDQVGDLRPLQGDNDLPNFISPLLLQTYPGLFHIEGAARMSFSPARTLMGFPQIAADSVEVRERADQAPAQELPVSERTTDEDLMLRLRQGNLEALSHLYRRYARLVMSICLRIVRDPSEAEDLVQDVFVLLHQKRNLFDASKGSARSWLVQVTYHQAFNRRDHLKARRYYGQLPLNHAAAQMQTLLTAGSGSGDMFYWSSKLERALSELTPEQHLVLQLYYFEGYTVEEISKKMGHSTGNVRNHLYRGLEQMRRSIVNGHNGNAQKKRSL
jgi:RNA polymerase sigma-70 factor (ECF subfamily)